MSATGLFIFLIAIIGIAVLGGIDRSDCSSIRGICSYFG